MKQCSNGDMTHLVYLDFSDMLERKIMLKRKRLISLNSVKIVIPIYLILKGDDLPKHTNKQKKIKVKALFWFQCL